MVTKAKSKTEAKRLREQGAPAETWEELFATVGKEIEAEFILANGYEMPRKLADGTWAAIFPLMFTTSVITGIGAVSWKRRWCYETREEAERALRALKAWDDEALPGWVAKRPQD